MIYLHWPISFSKKGTKSYSCFLPEQLLWKLLLGVYYILDYALGPFEYSFSFDPPHPLGVGIKAQVSLGFEKLSDLFNCIQIGSIGAEIWTNVSVTPRLFQPELGKFFMILMWDEMTSWKAWGVIMPSMLFSVSAM